MRKNQEIDVIYLARLHWIIFGWPTLFICLALFIFFHFNIPKEVGFLLMFFGVAWLFITWVTFYFSSLTIKNKQLILRTGILIRETMDIPLARIESIDIRQSILGSILRYGSLVIVGTGGTRNAINYLDKPLTCRRYIEQLLHA